MFIAATWKLGLFALSAVLLANGALADAPVSEGVIDRRPALWQHARELNVQRLEMLDDGVGGRLNNSYLFLADSDQLNDPDAFYWAMVRTLSEKYACLMRQRTKTHNSYIFVCRDGRQVLINHGQRGKILYFYARYLAH